MSEETQVLPAVALNDAVTKAVQEATSPEAIRAALLAEAEKQKDATDATAAQAAADKKAAEEKAAADAANAAPQTFSRTETIGGKEFTFEASSELELEREITNAYKVAYAVQDRPAETQRTEVVDPSVAAAAAQKAAEDQAAAKAELELKFKRGEISAADFIEQSGAVDEYLAKKGLPIEALKAAVDQNQNSQFEKSWAQATEEFLHSAAGADWPGGAKNLEVIGLKIQALNLVDAPDKVAALAQAYASMKSTGMIFPGETATTTTTTTASADAAAAKAIADKAAADKLVADAAAAATRTATATKTEATSSSLFGKSSGVGATLGAAAPAAGAKIDIPANATPAEILEAWKTAQVAQGRDPNAAFVETFQARKA